jgi:hypothetical protein
MPTCSCWRHLAAVQVMMMAMVVVLFKAMVVVKAVMIMTMHVYV